MKKFLVSVLLCAGIVCSASPMKRKNQDELMMHLYGCESTELLTLSAEVLEQIACYLDGKSFSALAQVCEWLQRVCDAAPTKYLAFTFSDAASHGSIQLISRFIADRDEWMIQQGAGEDVFTLQADEVQNNETKILKRSLGKGLQDFLGNCSMYCISQNDEIFRYVFVCKNDEQAGDKKPFCVIFFNVKKNNQAINKASAECLKFAGIMIPLVGMFELATSPNIGCCAYGTIRGGAVNIHGFMIENGQALDARVQNFRIDSSLDSPDCVDKVFGLIATYIMAIQKNNVHVAYAILENESAFDCLQADILDNVFSYFLGAGYEISDIVDAIRFARLKAIESNAKK